MRGPRNALLVLGALCTLVVGAVHLQQYADFIKDVPTIGELFLLTGLGAGVVCMLLATRAQALGALAGIALSAGALVSLAISRYAGSGLFDYQEPTLRTPVAIAAIAELVAILTLAGGLDRSRRAARTS